MSFIERIMAHEWKASGWNKMDKDGDQGAHDYYFPDDRTDFTFEGPEADTNGDFLKVKVGGDTYDLTTKQGKETANYYLSPNGDSLSASYTGRQGEIVEFVTLQPHSGGEYLWHSVEFEDGIVAYWRCEPS